MKTLLNKFLIFFIAVTLLTFPTEVSAFSLIDIGEGALEKVLAVIMGIVLQLASLITMLGGVTLDFTIKYTIVEMAEHYSEIPSIDKAWTILRDLSNMLFIFLLLYAAIQMILGIGKDVRKLIVNMVIVALLINFSLLFTKIIIDAANLLALTFYKAIVPAAGTCSLLKCGISVSVTDLLGIASLYKAAGEVIGISTIITVGVLGSVVLLIAGFIFFAAALLFIIRYVVLIIVLVLSPIAFVAHIFPTLNEYKKQWWDALLGQAFFAPIFMILMWISIYILQGMPGVGKTEFKKALTGSATVGKEGLTFDPGMVGTIMNFIIVIIFMVAALIIAKKWADKAGGGMNKLTGMALGYAGGATLGMAGWAGRRTLGAYGARVADDNKLKEQAAQGGFTGMRARLNLAAGKRLGGASFDLRGAPAGGTLAAGKPQKGGFLEMKKKKAEEKAKFAGSLGPSEETVYKAEQDLKKYKAGDTQTANRIEKERSKERKQLEKRKQRLENRKRDMEEKGASPYEIEKIDKQIKQTEARHQDTENLDLYVQRRVDRMKGANTKEMGKREKEELENDLTIKAEKKLEEDIRNKENEIANTQIPELKKQREEELEVLKRGLDDAKRASAARTQQIKAKYRDAQGNYLDIQGAGAVRKAVYAETVADSAWAKFMGYNYAAAAKIAKSESAKDKAVKALEALKKEKIIETDDEEGEETPDKKSETGGDEAGKKNNPE